MIDLTVESLLDTNNKVALLGMEATIHAGLYQGKLIDKGLHVVHDDTIQQIINEIKSNNDLETVSKPAQLFPIVDAADCLVKEVVKVWVLLKKSYAF